MEDKDKNPFEGNGASEVVTKSKQDLLLEQAEKNSAEDLRKRKEGTVSKSSETKKARAKKTTTKASKKPKAEKKPRAKKEKKASASDRAPRIVLSEKQLSESRVVIRVLPAVHKMVEQFAKKKGLEVNEAADKLITTAWGRLGALARYNEKG